MVKWNLDVTPTGALPGQTLQPVDVLYEFDEPLIFRAEIGLTDYLLNKVSGKNGKSIYLACETNGEVVAALKEGRISVRGAFTAQKYLIISADRNSAVEFYWRVGLDEVPSRFLPPPGTPLFHWMKEAPDSLAEANSIFSMKFKGESLSHHSIPLGKLKNLVDRSFSAVRSLLTPPGLSASTSATLDFDCQIALSSFVVAVRDPIINMTSVKRRDRTNSLTKEIIEEAVRQQGFLLAERIGALAEATKDPRKAADYAADNLVLVSALSGILPDEDSFLDSVEFSSVHGSTTKKIVFNREVAAAVHAAAKVIDSRPVTDQGRIIGGSETARTVRIESFRGKKVTCHFSDDLFSLVAPEGKIDLSRYIKVTGPLERRPRVDFMSVDRFEFISPRTVFS